MLKAILTFAVVLMGTAIFAQDTHYAQFLLREQVSGETLTDLEAGLTKLPGVLQARVGKDGRNVLMSSIPGVPVLESEIQTVTTAMKLEYDCYRDGIVGVEPIRSLKDDCKLARRNIQD